MIFTKLDPRTKRKRPTFVQEGQEGETKELEGQDYSLHGQSNLTAHAEAE